MRPLRQEVLRKLMSPCTRQSQKNKRKSRRAQQEALGRWNRAMALKRGGFVEDVEGGREGEREAI